MSEQPMDVIRVSDGGAVRTILIDRAAHGNLLTLPMIDALAAAVRGTPADAKLVRLSGAGGDFCRGRDPQGNPLATSAQEIRRVLIEPILSLYDAIAACPVPVLCAVQGAARGLGAALASSCDITIAASSARFSLPEMEKNLPPTLAMTAMRSHVPRKTLSFLVYSMEEVDAVTACGWGLVSKVVDDDRLTAEGDALTAVLLARSRAAVVAVKEYQQASHEMGPRAARDFAANLLAGVLSSAGR